MRKVFVLVLFLFSIMSVAWAGWLDVGVNASLYTPSDSDSGVTLLYGVNANYFINPTWSARGEVQYSSYKTAGKNHTLLPIKLSAIGHLLPGQAVDPYLGVGVGYYIENIGDSSSSNVGGQLIAGIRYAFLNSSVGFEMQYVIPSFGPGSKGFLTYGGQLQGQAGFSVPF